MKILRKNVNGESQFSLLEVSSDDFYAIKHALAAHASRSLDPGKSSGMADYEKECAVSTWNRFREVEHHCIDVKE